MQSPSKKLKTPSTKVTLKSSTKTYSKLYPTSEKSLSSTCWRTSENTWSVTCMSSSVLRRKRSWHIINCKGATTTFQVCSLKWTIKSSMWRLSFLQSWCLMKHCAGVSKSLTVKEELTVTLCIVTSSLRNSRMNSFNSCTRSFRNMLSNRRKGRKFSKESSCLRWGGNRCSAIDLINL